MVKANKPKTLTRLMTQKDNTRCLQKLSLQTAILLLAALLFSWPAGAVEGPIAGEQVVLSVEITGNEYVSEDLVMRVLTHIRLGEPLSEVAIRKDLEAIRDLGYFSSVDARGEPFLGGVKVIFRVRENPLFKEFRIIGLEKADPEKILSYLTQKKGEVINYSRIGADLQEAITKYRENEGLFLTVIDEKSEVSADGVVTFYLAEVKMGEVIISGLEKTKEVVISRELSTKKGEILDMNKLREDYLSLTRLQYFEDIRMVPQPTSDPEVMDLLLDFKEGQSAIFNMGMTYVPVNNQLAGFVSIVEPNLRGFGQRVSFSLETNPGKFYHFGFEFNEPWLDEKNTSFGLRLYSNYNLAQTGKDDGAEYLYDGKNTGLELTLGRALTRNLRMDTSLQFDKVTLNPKSLVGTGTLPDDQEYWNNSVGLGLIQDKREISGMYYTTGGYMAQIGANFYGGILGGKYDYQRYTGDFRQFYSPGEYTTFGYRVKAGTLAGNTPSINQFGLGGPLSVRGYKENFIEGDRLLLTNVELRQRIPGNNAIELVAFYDLGSVDFKKYYQSYGLGFRYTIPLLGQLRFDFGWNNEETDPQPKFHFFVQEMF